MRFSRLIQLGLASVGLVVLAIPQARAADAPASSIAQALNDIETQQAKLSRDRIDPAVVASAAGGDPAKLLEWVRSNTRLVAYEGSLRGPLGVLMDRCGNSLDRSLLLAKLLELSGFEARIVRGQLSPDEMAKVLADGVRIPQAPAGASPGDPTQLDNLKAQASIIAADILSKAGNVSIAPPSISQTLYWVQYNDGKNWVDLDPCSAAPGQTRAKADGSPVPLDSTHSVPEDKKLQHTVKLWLLVERWENGKLVESPLLTYAFDARKSPIGSTTLTFMPVDPKQSKAVQRNFKTGAQLREKVLAETAWTPVLSDGKSGGQMARMFNDAGVVGDLPKSFDGAAEVGNVNRNAFGALMGAASGASDKTESPTVLTALVADYQIITPGKPDRRVRRFIFDSIGPEARASTAPLPRPKWTDDQRADRGADLAALNDMLVAFASLDTNTYIYRFGQRVIDSKDAALKVFKGAKDAATMSQFIDGSTLRSLELFAASRDSDLSSDLAVAEPQIYRRIIRYTPDAKASDLSAEIYSDLAWNRLTPVAGASNAAVTLAAQGVLDTLKESVVVLQSQPSAPTDNTPAMLAEAARQGIEITAFRDAKDARLSAFPGATRARMIRDIESGQVLVGPARPLTVAGQPRTACWRVDPASAQVVGEMDTGLLQDFVEYNETQEVNGVRITRFYRSRISPEARGWAEKMIRARGNTSWDQWINLLTYAQRAVDAGRFAMI